MAGSGWLWLVAILSYGLWWAVNSKRGGKTAGKRGTSGKNGSGGNGDKESGGELAKRLGNFALWTITIISVLHGPILWTTTYLAQIGANIAAWIVGLLQMEVPVGAIAEVILWILVVAAGMDLKGKKVDYVARTFIVAAPVLAILSTGPVGNAVENGLNHMNSGTVQVVQNLAQ